MNKRIKSDEFISVQTDLHPHIHDLITVSCQLSALYCALGNEEDSTEFQEDLRNVLDHARAKIAATANALDKIEVAQTRQG